MKKAHLNRFAGIHTAIATTLALSSASQGQTLYWDTDGTSTGFGTNFSGAWNGTNTLWNSDATGGAGGSLTATTTSSNALIVSGASNTGVINLSTNQSAASLDFANTANLAAFQLSDGASLTLTGAITDTGAGSADIRIINTSEANAATKLVASSVTMGVIGVTSAAGGVGQFFTTGYDVTIATQYSIGSGTGTGGNTTIRQTAGTVTVNNAADRGFVFLATNDFASSSLYTNRYILDGGTMKANRIGISNEDGNNNANNRWARDTRLEFNNGNLQSFTNGTLLLQNQLTFNTYTGSGTKDMGYNTSKPLTVELAQTGTHTFNADGASGLILVTPSAQLVNKTGENGTVTKTGLGNLVFTGGNPLAVNSYTGSTTVSAGTVSTDYNRIAGIAATGGTDNLSNGYSTGSQLVLNGGNYSLVGRGSAAVGSATSVALNANAAGMQVNVGSTTGLVIGQSVTNANLPTGTYIRRIISGTTIELSSMSTSTSNVTGQTLNFGAANFNNTQTINSVDLQQAGNATTVTVTPGTGTSTTLLSFGNVSGTGGFTKAGAGTLKLTGSLTYSGPTAVSAGTLEFAPVSGTSTLTGTFTGSGTIVKSDAGTTIISNGTPGANTFNGAVIVNGGTLSMGGVVGGLNAASSFAVNNGGILFVNSDALNFGPFGNLTVNAGGIFRGGVQQIGNVTLNGGTMDGTGGFSSVNFALNSDVTVGGSSASTIQGNQGLALAGSSAVAGTTRTFTVADATGNANADLTISTAVRNSYVNNFSTNLQKSGAGTMLLSGNSTYTGTTTVSVGTLLVNGSLGDTAVTVANGAFLGGSGTVGTSAVLNTLTVNGTLAPGKLAGHPDG